MTAASGGDSSSRRSSNVMYPNSARSLGIGETAIRRYLDLFTNLLMVRQLQPWHENLRKRQVKSPKIHVRDSGLLRTLRQSALK
jgi:predicted AAA+ superfamily ATPase